MGIEFKRQFTEVRMIPLLVLCEHDIITEDVTDNTVRCEKVEIHLTNPVGREVATAEYFMTPTDHVGYLGMIRVSRPLRRMGIGTRLTTAILGDMRSHDQQVCYARADSRAGYMLLRSFLFKPVPELRSPQQKWWSGFLKKEL